MLAPADAPIFTLVDGLAEAKVRAALHRWPTDALAGGDVRQPPCPVGCEGDHGTQWLHALFKVVEHDLASRSPVGAPEAGDGWWPAGVAQIRVVPGLARLDRVRVAEGHLHDARPGERSQRRQLANDWPRWRVAGVHVEAELRACAGSCCLAGQRAGGSLASFHHYGAVPTFGERERDRHRPRTGAAVHRDIDPAAVPFLKARRQRAVGHRKQFPAGGHTVCQRAANGDQPGDAADGIKHVQHALGRARQGVSIRDERCRVFVAQQLFAIHRELADRRVYGAGRHAGRRRRSWCGRQLRWRRRRLLLIRTSGGSEQGQSGHRSPDDSSPHQLSDPVIKYNVSGRSLVSRCHYSNKECGPSGTRNRAGRLLSRPCDWLVLTRD